VFGDERRSVLPQMTSTWQRLPPVPRAIATATLDTLTAAGSGDAVAFQRASLRLAALDREQVGLVLGAVVRSLLEELHPGGLSGDDVHDVLARCVGASAACFPAVDANVLLVLLAGSLGIHPDEEDPQPVSALQMSSHAPLLIATLLGGAAGRPFAAHLDAAFTEIARSETVEMP
jgi:hypothetical protein